MSSAAMTARVQRELKWLMGWFFLPLVLLIGSDLVFSNSPLPFWKRLVTLEDTCSYGICFILPAVLYILVLIIRMVVTALRRRRQITAD